MDFRIVSFKYLQLDAQHEFRSGVDLMELLLHHLPTFVCDLLGKYLISSAVQLELPPSPSPKGPDPSLQGSAFFHLPSTLLYVFFFLKGSQAFVLATQKLIILMSSYILLFISSNDYNGDNVGLRFLRLETFIHNNITVCYIVELKLWPKVSQKFMHLPKHKNIQILEIQVYMKKLWFPLALTTC